MRRRWILVAGLVGCGLDAVGSAAVDSASAPTPPSTFAPDDSGASGGEDAPVGVIDSAIDAPCTTDASTDLLNCGGCGLACPTGTEECIAGKCIARLRISLNLDGISDLVLQGNAMKWFHVRYVPPGATTLDTAVFTPSWPSPVPQPCNCDSLNSFALAPALPLRAQTVTIVQHGGRFPITLDQPSAANAYALRVRYNDDMGGFFFYDATITYETR